VGIDLATVAVVFGVIVVVELPDKTFIATLVMSTRFRPLLVWIGVGLAFLAQTAIAVAAGGLLARLPRTPVEVGAGLMFLVGGILLLRGAGAADTEEAETEEEFGAATERRAAPAERGTRGWKVVTLCFSVLFLAEWGDLSQLLTASLVARYDDPVSVFAGAWGALLIVSGLAAALGRTLLRRMRLSTIRRIGGTVCLLLAGYTALEVAGVW
jgi:Ca2+/H+ antiporter, TMEM165/GDT1 family